MLARRSLGGLLGIALHTHTYTQTNTHIHTCTLRACLDTHMYMHTHMQVMLTYASNKNIHFEVILDVGIGKKKKGNKISDLRCGGL